MVSLRYYGPEGHAIRNEESAVELSVIIPLFNEEQNIQALHEEIRDVLQAVERPYEIILINDGSTDGTPSIIDSLSEEYSSIKAVHLRRNFGKAAALSVGFRESRGGIIITMDGDLQDNPAEIPRFIEQIESGYDLVSGWKFRRRDPLSKTLPSRLFNKVVASTTGLELHDFNCGFKAYSRKLVDSLTLYGELHRYIPALAYGDGFRVGEIKVDHRRRVFGQSKYGWERYTRGLLDLLTVLFITRYTRKPLHLFGSVGLLLIGMGLAINTYLAVLWFLGNAIGHRPLLSLGVLLTVLGVQFVSTGLLGEMITNSHQRDEENYVDRRTGEPKRGRQD